MLLLTGLFWLPDSSVYSKVYYSAFAAPALLGLLLNPRLTGRLLREPMVLAFVALAGWLLVSLLWSTSDSASASLAKRPLYVFMLFAGCTLIAVRDQALLMKALHGTAVFASLAALVSVTHFLITQQEPRMTGLGALRNALLTSHVLGFFLAYWVARWLSGSEQHLWKPLLAALPLLAACLATGSRTPLMAMIVVCIGMLLFTWRRAGALLLVVMLLGLLGLLLEPQFLLQRGASYRPQLWAEALHKALEALWTGHGYDSRFVFDIPGRRNLLSDPHNVGLAVLLELGMIGLAVWSVMHLLGLVRCLQLRHLPKFQIACALLIYGVAAGLTEGSSFLARPNESWFIIWIPLALIAALSISQRGQPQQ
ncbi:O-antigen ligase domain-containing protein [Pseudomonas sp. UL070]|uniref:O-antigen ligase domain-containing protein n=1 Tax=Aquipseudomonas ullengensis TaxID=2759166 RepID=A0A7W4LID9_9GAMM|nr:O-antigen ligase domain-containing protein [Pseudomonas ullengensis]